MSLKAITQVDAVIAGAGAAGLMCAIEAGKRGRRVVVLEHGPQIGRKILISGGGRCNFTNLHTTAGNFLSRNPHFAKSALARFTPRDFIALVERHAIAYHEKTLGQLFCDGSASQIVAMLERECREAGVRTVTNAAVTSVRPGFSIETAAETWEAPNLVIATGGLSIPKMGATPFGYSVARQFGMSVVECYPALVPLTFRAADRQRFEGLAGVSADCEVAAGGRAFREKLLFTHRGLSGPAILQASSYWRAGETVTIDLTPGVDLLESLSEARAAGARSEVRTLLARYLPKRLADRWCEIHPQAAEGRPVAVLGDPALRAIAGSLQQWEWTPGGTEGYEKAEVTGGGVDTAGLSSQTMESRTVPGLYVIGEVVDVTGQLGGFNFQWAWASGAAAGRAL
ncbi:MAG: NAD(P)/FAD-dependent oxidoreductase [Candidatus Solibacter sp.]